MNKHSQLMGHTAESSDRAKSRRLVSYYPQHSEIKIQRVSDREQRLDYTLHRDQLLVNQVQRSYHRVSVDARQTYYERNAMRDTRPAERYCGASRQSAGPSVAHAAPASFPGGLARTPVIVCPSNDATLNRRQLKLIERSLKNAKTANLVAIMALSVSLVAMVSMAIGLFMTRF